MYENKPLKRKARLAIVLSAMLLVWCALGFIGGYFGGVRGVERGLESGLVVAAIFASIPVGGGALAWAAIAGMRWVEKGRADED